MCENLVVSKKPFLQIFLFIYFYTRVHSRFSRVSLAHPANRITVLRNFEANPFLALSRHTVCTFRAYPDKTFHFGDRFVILFFYFYPKHIYKFVWSFWQSFRESFHLFPKEQINEYIIFLIHPINSRSPRNFICKVKN